MKTDILALIVFFMMGFNLCIPVTQKQFEIDSISIKAEPLGDGIDWNWTIENDMVFINNSKAYLSANPHTLVDDGWVEFELESKIFSGDIDAIWGFNSSEAHPSNPEIWLNYTHDMIGRRWVEQYLNTTLWVTAGMNLGIENYDLYDVDIGNKNNTKLWNLSCISYEELDDEWYNYSVIIAFTSQTSVDDNYTFFYYDEAWQTYHYDSTFFDWKTFERDITVVNHDWKGFNKWYMVNASINSGHRYRVRCWVDIPFGGLGGSSGKYIWAIKEHSKTMHEAIESGRLIYLDPWWDSDWSYYKTLEVADKIDNYQMKLLVDFDADVGGNISCDGHCQADFDDLRFVYDNTTELPYWIKNVTVSTQATIWINISTYDKFEMFYGNAGVGNNSDGDATFIFFDHFLGDSIDADKWTVVEDVSVSGSVVTVGGGTAKSRIYSKDIFSYSIVACKVRTNSPRYGTLLQIVDLPSANNFILCDPYPYTDNFGVRTKNDGGTITSTKTGTPEDTIYHRVRTKWESSSSVKVLIDADETTVTANVPDDTPNLSIGFSMDSASDAGNIVEVDWVFNRKYSSTPSYWSAFGSEQGEAPAPNHKPWYSSPSPVNESVDNPVSPTLSIYANDTDGDTMDITWYEGNFTTLSNISFIGDKHTGQGVAVNDTFYWTTAGDDNFHIYKYWVSNDTEVLNRDVETDLPSAITQINSLYLDETNDLLYVGANNYSGGVASEGWIAVFNSDDLTYSTIHELSHTNCSEGGSYHNGSWWVVDNFERKVWNFDTSFNYVDSYALSYTITGSIHDGYNGITWYGNDIFVGTHDTIDQHYVIDRYHWNGDGFDEVRRYFSSTGDLPDNCDQGIYYYDNYFYSCMRNVQGAYIDGICKLELTGWNEIQQNNTVNNGTYNCNFNNATLNSHTYYWKISVTDGTDTNQSWFYFTIEIGNAAPTLSGEIPADGSTSISRWAACNVTCNDQNGDSLTIYFYENTTGNWVLQQTNGSHTANTSAVWGNYTNASAYSTKYYWSVNVSDGTNWCNETYHFTTESATNNAPTQSGEAPSNGSANIPVIPSLYVICTDADIDIMTATWRSNSSSNWVTFATNTSISSGTNITQLNSNFSACSTTYWWSINLTDSTDWCNETYHFTTVSNQAPIIGNPYPSNTSTSIEITPTLTVDVSDADGDTMNLTWYEGNYTTLSNITFLSDKKANQGVAVNSTYYWTSATPDNFHIYKYWVSNNTEILNRDVEGDLPVAVSQINSIYLDESNNMLYIGGNDYSGGVSTESWIFEFSAVDLTHSATHSMPYETCGEGTSFHNGSWWNVDNFERKIWNYDISWNHIANYTLSYPITGSIHDGYNGITWYGNDIFVGTHADIDQEYVVDRYHWNGDGFNEVRRYLSSEGDLPDNCDQGIYYYDNYFYSCMRNAQGTYVDGICKLGLTGWHQVQVNNTVNNGTYYYNFDNASAYNHTYYWKVSVTDGTDTNESWFSFTTEIAKQWVTLDTWNITMGNMSISPYTLDTWNLTLGNTPQSYVLDTWNLTIGNLTISPFTIDTWNITLSNTPQPYILDTWNISIGNLTILPYILDTWNISIGNLSISPHILDTWNLTIGNLTISPYILDTWNITLSNTTALDSTPPNIIINFAGNLSDSGGPYWRPPDESTQLTGDWSDGYYTNDSRQQEGWMYINLTVSDGGGVPNVWLQWKNESTWTNYTYAFLNTTGGYFEFNTSGNISTGEGYNYSFDIVANDTTGNSKNVWWNKTGMYGNVGTTPVRRYIQLNCSQTNITYTPYYLIKVNETHHENNDDWDHDRLHHDQGTDGTATDAGYLRTCIPSDTVEWIYCVSYVAHWFDESVCTESFALNNIYYHIWWSSDTDELTGGEGVDGTGAGWTKSRENMPGEFEAVSSYLINSFNMFGNASASNITYNNENADYSNNYHLNTHFLTTDSTDFTDNDIYELNVLFAELSQEPSTISNRSFTSFVLFNVPDNATLNASHADTDSDSLSDWTELYVTYTNPFLADTDNDGVSDYDETLSGSDPNNYTDTIEYKVWVTLDTWNLTLGNMSISPYTLDTWNVTLSNTTESTILDTWNITLSNTTVGVILDTWNVTIGNLSISPFTIDMWNITLSNTTQSYILDTWNITLSNLTISSYVLDRWNITLSNMAEGDILDTWNITLGNLTISSYILDTWNITLSNTSSHAILEPSFETVNNWIYYENKSGCFGEQSGSGVTDGSKSYGLAVQSNVGTGYCKVYQTYINLTGINNIYADLFLNSDVAIDVPAYVSLRVNDDILYERKIGQTETVLIGNVSIDVSGYGDYCTLEYRLNQTDVGIYDEGIFAYIDNIRTKIWHTLDTWNITLSNQTISPYTLDTWNITLSNTPQPYTLDTWNVTLSNLTITPYILDTWNLTLSNMAEGNILDTWNITLGNLTIAPFILDTWNLTIGNLTISPFTIDTWNLTLSNTTQSYILDTWNLTLNNLTISQFTIDTWNLTIGNLTITPFILDTWNVTLSNTSITEGEILDTWNLTIGNMTISPFTIDTWNVTIGNLTVAWVTLDIWNLMLSNTTEGEILDQWNLTLSNISWLITLDIWNVTLSNTTLNPNPPTSFTATANGETQIDLTWNKGDGADKTYIEWKPSGMWDRGDGTFLYNNTGTSTSNVGLAPETSRCYEGWSYNDTYDTWSDTYVSDCATTDSPPPPPNNPPNIANEYPENTDIGILITPLCHVYVTDADADLTTVSFFNSTDGITYTIQQTNNTISSGTTVTWRYAQATLYDTIYYWRVTANDGIDTTTENYYFTTYESMENWPTITNEKPTHQSIEQNLTINWTVYIADPNGDAINWTINCSNGQNSSADLDVNGTKNVTLSGLTEYTTYTVFVNVTDGTNWVRKQYTFMTVLVTFNGRFTYVVNGGMVTITPILHGVTHYKWTVVNETGVTGSTPWIAIKDVGNYILGFVYPTTLRVTLSIKNVVVDRVGDDYSGEIRVYKSSFDKTKPAVEEPPPEPSNVFKDIADAVRKWFGERNTGELLFMVVIAVIAALFVIKKKYPQKKFIYPILKKRKKKE